MADQVVTIEGSITPSSELPRGVRKTVLYTDRIKKLADRGYIKIIDGPRDSQTPTTTGNGPVVTNVTATGGGPGPVPKPTPPPAAPEVPQHPDETAQPEVPVADVQRTEQASASAGATQDVQTGEQPTG